MEPVDAQGIGVHGDQADIGLVTADDKPLKAFWPVVEFVEAIGELLFGCSDLHRIIELCQFASIPTVEVMAAVPALDRNPGRFGKIRRCTGVSGLMLHRWCLSHWFAGGSVG